MLKVLKENVNKTTDIIYENANKWAIEMKRTLQDMKVEIETTNKIPTRKKKTKKILKILPRGVLEISLITRQQVRIDRISGIEVRMDISLKEMLNQKKILAQNIQ